MAEAMLEHVNLTVRNAKATAERLCKIFDWRIRWEGASIHDGYSVHVGGKTSYLALYNPAKQPSDGSESYYIVNGLNHLGVTVDDLSDAETQVKAAGYQTYSHSDYEPGKRFYFEDEDGVEYEVVSYA